MTPPFFAHSGDKADLSDWQLLTVHLRRVAEQAKNRMADAVPNDASLANLADAAGWLHDLGKYRSEFQQMIRNIRVQKEKTWHKQAGAAKAYDVKNVPVAFAIAGHLWWIAGCDEAERCREWSFGANRCQFRLVRSDRRLPGTTTRQFGSGC